MKVTVIKGREGAGSLVSEGEGRRRSASRGAGASCLQACAKGGASAVSWSKLQLDMRRVPGSC